MRGVYYRTEKDGTPLATPELRISATNNRTVYYDNQNAKEDTQYINDAYNYVYQKLINRGDSFFVN